MNVPFVDLRIQYLSIKSEIDNAIQGVIDSTAFVGGRYVKKFEKQFADYCHRTHCIGVGNGTDALTLSLKAIGLQPGDEVITAANTFIATAEAITNAGGKPVFVDIDPKTYTIDPTKIEENITDKTRAIIPVHLYGHPAEMDSIIEIAQRYDLSIIEDTAQAHGAEYNGQNVGTFGDIACYSFYPSKNLGAFGDAGAVLTDDDDIAQNVRMLGDHGSTKKYSHKFEGCNSRLDGLQAAVLGVKLQYLNKWNEMRRENANSYSKLLKETSLIPPTENPNSKHVYHLYVISGIVQRQKCRDFLNEYGIASGIHYPSILPNMKAYEYLGYRKGDFPVAEKYATEILSLPMYPELTKRQITYVVDKLRAFTEK